MKRRNREIQIFNLSMMDVISGAMGAFLIIMIILSRYYTPDPQAAKDAHKIKEKLKEVQQELLLIKKEMPDDYWKLKRLLDQALDDLDRAEDMVDNLQDRVDQLNSENKRLHNENEKLDNEVRDLRTRDAFLIHARWAVSGADVDVFAEQIQPANNGELKPRFHPTEQQWNTYSDETYIDFTDGPGDDLWLIHNRFDNIDKKIFFKVQNIDTFYGSVTVNGGIYGKSTKDIWLEFPTIFLDRSRPWEFVGTISVNNHKVTFKEATQAERDIEHAEVEKRFRLEKEKKDLENQKLELEKQRQDGSLPSLKGKSQAKPMTPQERKEASRKLIMERITDPKMREEALRHLNAGQ